MTVPAGSPTPRDEGAELLDDLRELGKHPLTYGQETHGELHLDAERFVAALLSEREAARAVVEAAREAEDALGSLEALGVTGYAAWSKLKFALARFDVSRLGEQG